MEKKGSVSVTVFGILFILFAAWGILQLVIHISLGWGKPAYVFFTTRVLSILRLWMLPLIYASFLIASIGIFKLYSWARKLAILLSSLIVLFYIFFIPISIKAGFDLLIYAFGQRGVKAIVIDTLTMLLIALMFLYIIYFFTRPKVKEQFK